MFLFQPTLAINTTKSTGLLSACGFPKLAVLFKRRINVNANEHYLSKGHTFDREESQLTKSCKSYSTINTAFIMCSISIQIMKHLWRRKRQNYSHKPTPNVLVELWHLRLWGFLLTERLSSIPLYVQLIFFQLFSQRQLSFVHHINSLWIPFQGWMPVQLLLCTRMFHVYKLGSQTSSQGWI